VTSLCLRRCIYALSPGSILHGNQEALVPSLAVPKGLCYANCDLTGLCSCVVLVRLVPGTDSLLSCHTVNTNSRSCFLSATCSTGVGPYHVSCWIQYILRKVLLGALWTPPSPWPGKRFFYCFISSVSRLPVAFWRAVPYDSEFPLRRADGQRCPFAQENVHTPHPAGYVCPRLWSFNGLMTAGWFQPSAAAAARSHPRAAGLFLWSLSECFRVGVFAPLTMVGFEVVRLGKLNAAGCLSLQILQN
jgi:hypothetical protein